jgi:cysteine desulfurase / selenocysteine lyase
LDQPRPRPECAAARAAEFPHLSDVVYLNTASYGPQPQSALAETRAFEDRRAAVQLRPEDFGAAVDRARTACAALIAADPAEIALVPNTSVGLNLAAALLRQGAGNAASASGAGSAGSANRRAIVLPDTEFPANVYPWMALERDGFRVERQALAGGVPDEDALVERVARGDVAALAISAVQFSSGHAADLTRLGAACREYGTLFVVDAIQAVGSMPLDVHAARIDVLASGAHKWLCSPFGTGFTYVRRELVQQFEPDLPGWLAFESSADFESLVDYTWDFWPDARRFEVGSLAIQGFIGLAVAAELITGIGLPVIREHSLALQRPLTEWAEGRDGFRCLTGSREHQSSIVSIRTDTAAELSAALAERGIVTVAREGAVRFAPHFFNTMEEVRSVVDVLDSLTDRA